MPAAFQPSDSLTFKYGRLLVMSPPGEGKTFNGLTLSAKAPEKWPDKAAAPIVLDDIIVVLFDSGGLDGLAERGIKVPYVVDMSTMSAHQILTSLPEVKALITKQVATGTIRGLMWDTMTVLDKILLARHISMYEKWAIYQAQLKEHMQVFEFLKGLQCHVLINFHEKFSMPNEDRTSKMRADASGIEQGTIGIDITGDAKALYRGNNSLRLALNKQKRMDGKFDYWLYPQLEGTDAKSRFAFLADKEPAHLGKLIEKIRANTKVA